MPGAENAPAALWEMMSEGRGTRHGLVVKHNLEQPVQPGLEPAKARARSCQPRGAPGSPGCRRTPLAARAGLSISCQGRQCLPVEAAPTAALQHLQQNGAAQGIPPAGDGETCLEQSS